MLTSQSLKDLATFNFNALLVSTCGSTASIRFYTGSAPATPEDSATGTEIVRCVMNSTPFTWAGGQLINAGGISEGTAVADGTVGYGRLYTSVSECIMQFTCDDSPGMDFIFDSLDFVIDDTLVIDPVNLLLILAP